MVGLSGRFQTAGGSGEPKGNGAASRFPFPLPRHNHRRIKSEYQGEFLQPKSVLVNAWLSRTISVACNLLALFSRPLPFVFNELQPLIGKRGGWGYLVVKFRLTKLVEITTSFAAAVFVDKAVGSEEALAMAPSYVLLLAFGIGIIAGLRSLTAPAVVACAAHRGWLNLHGTALAFMGSTAAVAIFTVLAVVELVADQ